MSNARGFPVDDGTARGECRSGDGDTSTLPTTPLKPTSPPKPFHVFRCCIPLVVALCLFSLNSLHAQFPVPDDFNPGASGWVGSLAVQTDGKYLVGGDFTNLGGQPRNYIGRLNADGTLDNTFNPGASFRVLSLAVQADGKILVGGLFTTLGGQPCNYLGRINAMEPWTTLSIRE